VGTIYEVQFPEGKKIHDSYKCDACHMYRAVDGDNQPNLPYLGRIKKNVSRVNNSTPEKAPLTGHDMPRQKYHFHEMLPALLELASKEYF
jgi:hypothetical protein